MSLVQVAGDGSNLSAAILRRRRTVAVLLALTVSAVLAAAGSNTVAGWLATLGVAILASSYLGLAHRARRVATERTFAAWSASQPGFLDVLSDARLAESAGTTIEAVRQAQPSTWALVRFAASYAAGWALSPLVFALTVLAGRTPKDATSQRWLANIQAAQDRLREQSLRTLAVSAATTASVAAAGTIAAMGPPTAASAATITSSASLPASPSVAAAVTGVTHRVVAGDTLWGIANEYGVSMPAIISANRIRDPNLIYPGQVLFIPGGRATAVSAPARGVATPSTYRVRSGDTLSAIAYRFGTTVSALAAANHISNPNFIEVGELLYLDGRTATLTSTVTRSPAPATTTPATATQVAVNVAREQVGKPYQWAGAGPYSFDCSGLVMYAWEHAGVQLPHYSVAQYEDTARISEAELRPGDLVFYDTGDGAQPGHVTIYIGGGQVITADSPGTYVKVVPLTWDGRPMGFGRVR